MLKVGLSPEHGVTLHYPGGGAGGGEIIVICTSLQLRPRQLAGWLVSKLLQLAKKTTKLIGRMFSHGAQNIYN